jgi:hypothetical protein
MTVAWVTKLGYLACVACAKRLDIVGTPVHHDANPHNTEACDYCGKSVEAK